MHVREYCFYTYTFNANVIIFYQRARICGVRQVCLADLPSCACFYCVPPPESRTDGLTIVS